ncbi:unnamed protein product, partial [Ilex paraguariensis]
METRSSKKHGKGLIGDGDDAHEVGLGGAQGADFGGGHGLGLFIEGNNIDEASTVGERIVVGIMGEAMIVEGAMGGAPCRRGGNFGLVSGIGMRGAPQAMPREAQTALGQAMGGAQDAEALAPNHGGDLGSTSDSRKYADKFGDTLGNVRKRLSNDLSRPSSQ